MPAILLTPLISGGTNILSGNYWSGQGIQKPYSEVRVKADWRNSGFIYVALSGSVSGGTSITVDSGTFQQSGSVISGLGSMDGWQLKAGEEYRIPKLAFPPIESGWPSVFVQCDAAGSGRDRVIYEIL